MTILPDDPVIYLAGPMSGLPEFGFPAFKNAVERLDFLLPNALVLSPTDNVIGERGSESYETYLRRGLQQLLRCNVVALLPGWEKSKGASLEAFVGKRIGCVLIDAETLQPISTSLLFDAYEVLFR